MKPLSEIRGLGLCKYSEHTNTRQISKLRRSTVFVSGCSPSTLPRRTFINQRVLFHRSIHTWWRVELNDTSSRVESTFKGFLQQLQTA